ncbi:PREDICTED: tctex1 domain-containing protein 3 [Gavialis gangeticus]|uniref:tctex1 domain-containing protein 3 n=1 Tax=Gavialis gangeticus TaxID=94835 RepID=UPI00092EC899|nr:PREDICTED: tctex1 domain-containing protein 3 [Gavialis gangeticus]XP_019382849.1 PREDICTED: tctex1 domain-containing protein 3 [Gavialis gangeticus]
MEKPGQKLKQPPLPGGGAKRRTSMFEKENFAQLLKERIRNSSHDVCGTEPVEEESMAEFGKTELFALKAMTKLRYANTYRMEPNSKFQAHLVGKKIQQILTNRLQKVNYDGAASNFLCTSISEEIIASVKAMGFDRYKYVVTVLTVEKTGQAINIASRWLWDVARDDWVSAKCEMESFVVLALLVACYFE